MATSIPSVYEFTVDLIGDMSAQKFQGKFTLKTVLTHKEQLHRDELRRLYLGSFNQAQPSPRAANQADVFSDINARLVDFTVKNCPSWWKENDMGLGLMDDNVIMAIHDGMEKGIAERKTLLEAAIAEVRGEVKTLQAAAQ